MTSRRVLSRGRWTICLRSPLRSTGRVVAGVGRGMRCTRRVLLAGDLLRIAWMRISLWFLCRRGWWLLGNRVPLLLDVVVQVYLAFITLIINFKIWICKSLLFIHCIHWCVGSMSLEALQVLFEPLLWLQILFLVCITVQVRKAWFFRLRDRR